MPLASLRHRRIWFRPLAVGAGALLTLLAVELALRLTAPYKTHRAGREQRHFRQGGAALAQRYEVDPYFGFRPRLGTDRYSEWGTLPNPYPREKRPDVARVLFSGDSATHRGKLIEALRALYGDERFEYWNAGVESFNTAQELEFFRQFNSKADPDHVVLTFHLNDFQTTPVAFFDDDGALVVYTPHRPHRVVSPLLFRHLHLYRVYLGLTTRRAAARSQVEREIERALVEFRFAVEPAARFSVVVLPILSPPAEWSPQEARARRVTLEILERHAIHHVDLFPVLESALRQGEILGDPPGDPWHPSDTFAAAAARYLHGRRLLSGPDPPPAG